MAQPTPSTAFFLCMAAALVLLSDVADARLRYDLPDFQDLRVREPTTTTDGQFPDGDPVLRLPSEKPTAAHVEDLDAGETWKPAKEEEQKTVEEVPLTVVRFRPINRHFAIRPISRIHRGGAHRCHHGEIVRGLRPWTPRYGRIRHLPYDGVLTAAGGRDSTTDDRRRTFGDSANLPLRWGQPDYKHRRPVIDLSNDVILPAEIKEPHHHRRGDVEHQHENLILHKIRKFLNQF